MVADWGRELWLACWMVAAWSVGDATPMPYWWQRADLDVLRL